MKKIFMLTAANISKAKGQAFSLLLFVLIAAMFFNMGLMLYIDYGKSFDIRFEQRNAPHMLMLQSESATTTAQEDYLRQYPQVTGFEKQNVISGNGDYFMNGAKATGIILFSSYDPSLTTAPTQTMDSPQLLGESLPLEGNGIYVPNMLKTAGGYKLGDDYQINLGGTELYFKIAGFNEEMSFGAMMISRFRFYIPSERYIELHEQFPAYRSTLQSVRMEDSSLGAQLQLDYTKEFFYSQDETNSTDTNAQLAFGVSFDEIKNARTFIPTIMALVVVAFAIILLVVCLIVIRFRIINSIEEGMTAIGTLKAIGYKNGQVIGSIVMQFSSIALIGGVIGIIAAQALAPLCATILESQSAFVWNPVFNTALSAAALCLTLGTVLLVTFSVARRIRRLPPLVALRSGLATHSFRKNRIALDSSRGSLPFMLAIKQLVQNKKQAMMIAVVIAVVSFASIAGLSIYYNIGVETEAFMTVIAGEKPDLGLLLKVPDNEFASQLSKKPEVRKAFGYQNITLLMNEYNVTTFLADDFSQLEGGILYQGSYPRHDNEIAVNGLIARTVGLQIGDWVVVQQGNNQEEYLITGIIQLMENNGTNTLMTTGGLLRIQDEFEFTQIYVYLNEGEDPDTFVAKLITDEGDIFSNTVVMQELIDAQFSSYGDIFAAVAFGILAVTALVVILVLYMVIKTMILRRRRDIGIQKALGFTTLQLMNQIALNFTPIALIGVALGGMGGYYGFNPIFAALTRGAGIMKTDLPSPTGWTIITCIALVVLTYLISMLIAWRIRKISAYALVSE